MDYTDAAILLPLRIRDIRSGDFLKRIYPVPNALAPWTLALIVMLPGMDQDMVDGCAIRGRMAVMQGLEITLIE